MKALLGNLVGTLLVFFVAVMLTIVLDVLGHGTITGQGMSGSVACAAAVTCWHLYRVHRQMRRDAREERLRMRGEAQRMVQWYQEQNLLKGGGLEL